jgi:hypothetical protein
VKLGTTSAQHRHGSSSPVEGPQKTHSQIIVPSTIAITTFEAFVPYWKAGVETAFYWAGPDTNGQKVVTTLVQPSLSQTGRNYQVTAQSRARMAQELSEQELVVHAQVHTHPGSWVGHSPYDDNHAYSTREGSISIVWPNYGRTCSHDLSEVGILTRQNGRWVELVDREDRSAHVQIVESRVDLRWMIHPGGLDEKE